MALDIVSIWHVVQFSQDAPRAPVEAAYNALLGARARGELDFSYLRLGETVERAVADGMLGGPLRIAVPATHLVLVVGLASPAALDAYYAAPAHARIRRQLFSALVPRAVELYAQADADPGEAAHLYAMIETALRPMLTRMDIFVDPDAHHG